MSRPPAAAARASSFILDGSPSGCSLKYRAGEVLFDRDTRPVYWKNDSPDLTLVP